MKFALAYKLIAAVMIAVLGLAAVGSGVVFAAADSIPGDTLYPVKLAVEDARLAMTSGPAQKVKLNLAFANERVEEMRQLEAQGKMMPEEGISRMTRHTEQAMEHIGRVHPDDAPPLLEQVLQTTAAQTQVLEAALNTAADLDRPTLRNALEITTRTRTRATDAQGSTNRNENQDQNRNRNNQGPQDDPQPTTLPVTPTVAISPTVTITITVTPVQNRTQEQEQNRERNQVQPTETPVAGPQENQNTEQNQHQNRNQLATTPAPGENTDPNPTPTVTPQQNKEQNQDQNREQNQPTLPVATPQVENNREHNDLTPTPQAGDPGKSKN
ncbi:MAG: hypothetical protein JW934_13145 [Anaerolineae bacterium]|nr:hypothetical protein [Anaerolineae bacterium]